jgi:C-terminal processing protease CtpA/Prc
MQRLKQIIPQLLLALILGIHLHPGVLLAQEESSTPPPAELANDEGGPVRVTGKVTYTNPFFTLGVAQPLVILEDQAGFVDRNEYFIMAVESQTLGQITSDFYNSPFSYSIALPVEPQGSYRDVSQDGEENRGVQIFAIAYWTNTFGDAFLEERDLGGGGWSTAYASTRTSTDPETIREIIGGKLIVYAPDDEQGFPSGFGEDGLLFTEDDPIVILPQGYTAVDLDTEPFTFDRSRYQEIDLIEPETVALVDLSDLAYDEAFNELVDILSREYAFTEYKGIDWEALRAEFLPRFEAATAANDQRAYLRALRDFVWSIPDGHLSAPFLSQDFAEAVTGGLGIAIRELDDGRTIVNFVTPNSPAEQAGIRLGTEIVAMNDVPIREFVDDAVAWPAPFSTEHVERLEKLRYATRFRLGEEVTVTFVDENGEETTATMTAINERQSFGASSLNLGRTGFELPVEYRLLAPGVAYVKVNSFSDNSLLAVQLWERMMRTLNRLGVENLVIDMRQNAGGIGFLSTQMAAYFFNEPHRLGNTARYNHARGEFYMDARGERRFYLPSEDLRYNGNIAVVVGPNCNSACEFFSYAMTLQDRAIIIGHYPTAGLGGSISQLRMPGNETFQYTTGRAMDADGNIHIEGIGVEPHIRVPVTEEILLAPGDPLLEVAVSYLAERAALTVVDGGTLAIGDESAGTLAPNSAVRYTLDAREGDVLEIIASSDIFTPAIAVYDLRNTRLAISSELEREGTMAAGFETLTIPRDLTLILELSAGRAGESGDYLLSVQPAADEP